jgi:hypothetical protein
MSELPTTSLRDAESVVSFKRDGRAVQQPFQRGQFWLQVVSGHTDLFFIISSRERLDLFVTVAKGPSPRTSARLGRG